MLQGTTQALQARRVSASEASTGLRPVAGQLVPQASMLAILTTSGCWSSYASDVPMVFLMSVRVPVVRLRTLGPWQSGTPR